MQVFVAAVIALGVLLTSGCARSLPSAAANTSDAAVAGIQSSLDEAVTAAKSYGQQHLGHYLELDRNALHVEGFAPAEQVTITVFVDHLTACISATTQALPADSEWSTATATTDTPDPAAGGRCSSDALRTFTIRG